MPIKSLRERKSLFSQGLVDTGRCLQLVDGFVDGNHPFGDNGLPTDHPHSRVGLPRLQPPRWLCGRKHTFAGNQPP